MHQRFTIPIAAAVMLGALALASPASALEKELGAQGGDLLGYSVALDGDTAVVGAPADANGTGAVYVSRRSGDDWAQTGRLPASEGSSGDVLGPSVGIDGDEIVAGAP